jgi:hypothetical protein
MQDKRKLTLFGAGLAVLAAALVGCETTKTSHDQRSEGRQIDDKHITSRVKEALNREPVYKFEGVEVNTFAGIVQLSGFVNISEQKLRAQEIASHQEGVSQVLNGLALKPVMVPTGQQLNPSGSVEERVYTNPAPPATPKDQQPK